MKVKERAQLLDILAELRTEIDAAERNISGTGIYSDKPAKAAAVAEEALREASKVALRGARKCGAVVRRLGGV